MPTVTKYLNVSVDSGWVPIHTTLSIPIGTALQISPEELTSKVSGERMRSIRLQDAILEPENPLGAINVDGMSISSVYAEPDPDAVGEQTWVRTDSTSDITVIVQYKS